MGIVWNGYYIYWISQNMINVYIEPHYWTGKLKTRCNVCHRVAYEDEETAKAVAEKLVNGTQWLLSLI